MSASEKMTKLEGKEKSVDFVEKVSSTKLEKIKSETCIRPRFASHTLSSLMKTRTPINLKKSSSLMRSARTSKKSQKGLLYNRPNGIYKRRSIAKQNKNMQTLMTVLKWEKNYRASVSLSRQDNELTGTVSECVENSLAFLSSDLIKDISLDLKKCTESPAKLVVPRGEPAKVVDQFEKHMEDSQTLLQEKMGHMDLSLCQNNSENIGDNVKSCTIADIARQLQSDDEEKSCANSSHEIEVPHCKLGPSEPEEKLEENKDCTAIETQVPRQNVPTIVKDYTSEYLTLRKYVLSRKNRKRASRKAETKHVDIDRAHNVNLQDSRNCKFMRHNNNSWDMDDKSTVNCNVPITKKGALKKSLVFTNQQVWRPPGVTKSSIIKSTMSSTQPASQKSSRSTKRSIAFMENKYSSVKPVE